MHTSPIRNLIPLLGALALAACQGSVSVPVASAGAAQTVTTGSFVQLDAGASTDPQGRELSFRWSFAARPLGSVSQLIDPESAKTSFIADMAGAYTVKVTVSNSIQQSESTVTVTAAACTKPVLATPTFKVAGAAVGTAFKGDRIDLAVAATFGNCTNSLSYTWELTPRAGSSASISRQGFATASFIADVFGGAFDVSVTATDTLGNTSDAVSLSVPVSACGSGVPVVDFGISTAAAAFDPRTLTPAAVTNPDDAGACPSRFSQRPYALTWSVISPPNARYSLSAAAVPEGTAVSFTPQQNAAFTVQLVATGSKGAVTAAVSKQIVVDCAVPFTVGAPNISAPFFSGDRVTVSTATASLCRSTSDTFSYRWTLLERPAGSSASLNSATLAQPSFLADVPGGTYRLQVEVADSIGNTITSTVASFAAGACGGNPILASAAEVTAGAPRPFDPRTLKVAPAGGRTTFSDDDDATKCPARFAQTYTFAWTSSGGTVSAPAAAQTNFAPGGSASFSIQVLVKGSSGQSTTATVNVDAQCSAPFVTSSAVSASFAGPDVGSAPPRGSLAGAINVYRSDVVTVSTGAASSCFSAASAGLTYDWTLTGASGTVTHVSTATATFTVDQANGSYAASVVVKDALGNASAASSASFKAASCGANPISASISVTPGARPFDDLLVTATPVGTTFSNDDVGTICPAVFAGQYTFAWSLAGSTPNPGSIFSPSQGKTVAFSPGGNAVYDVKLAVTGGSRQPTEFFHQLTVSCPDVVPKAGPIFVTGNTAGYNSGTFTGRFFRDDTVALSTASPTSLCFTNPVAASYLWTLTRPLGSIDTTSFDITSPRPTFVADVSAGQWEVTVIVLDKLGNRSDPRTQRFNAESCGINPVVATFSDTRVGIAPFAAFDPHDLQAAAFSNDDDPARCPARFRNTSYAFSNLQVTPPGGATAWKFTASSSSAGRFEAGENSLFGASVNAQGNTSHVLGSGSFNILVDCVTPSPTTTAPTIASVTDPDGVTVPNQIFRDDTVTLGTIPSAACYTGTNFQPAYQWSFAAGTTDAAAAFSDATAGLPTFLVNQAGGIYAVSVEVRDQWGNGPVTNAATFTAETCGANPVNVSVILGGQVGGTLPFDPWTLSAFATSRDSDVAFCPQARFHDTYQITAWSVSALHSNRFSVSPTSGPTTTFREGEPASHTYGVTATATATATGHSGSGVQNITTAACASPAPTFTRESGTASAIGASATPPAPDPYYATHPEDFFSGDTVNLTAPSSFSCYTAQTEAAATYSWSTVAPPSVSFSPSVTSPTPSFTADAPSKTWHLRVAVQDHWGNGDFRTRDLTSGGCGAFPISAAITAVQAGGAKPMDPRTLTAVPASGGFFSADSDPAACPARFAATYTFAWSADASTPPATFNTASSNPTIFTPGAPQPYTVHLVVSGNGQNGTADQAVNASCGAPVVTSPTLAFINGLPPTGTIFVGDIVQVSTAVTSQCFAAPTLSYTYALSVNGGSASEPFVPDQHFPQPSFRPQTVGGQYDVFVTVSDGSGQTGAAGTPLHVPVSNCGPADLPQATTMTATQHFDNIAQQIEGGVTAPGPLNITQTMPFLTPSVDAVIGTTPHTVSVPFYLNNSITIDVTISVPPNCPNARFTQATLQDPHFELIQSDRFTQPDATTVSTDQHLHFSFIPNVGDERTGGIIHPGFHSLSINFEYGSTNEPFTAIAAPTPINVGGRCGQNVPFADAIFNPDFSVPAGTTLAIDTSSSSDADNETLNLLASDLSTGCGLQQQFTYAWFLQGAPAGSTAQVLPGAPPAQFSFTPDLLGGYDLELQVTDDTAAPAGPRTGTRAFHVTAGPGITFAQAPAHGTTNFALGNLVVAFKDAQGNDCATCTGTVSLNASGGSGTLTGTLSLSGTGLVTFTGLTISAAGTYTLTATSDVGAIATAVIQVTDPSLAVAVSSAQTVNQAFNVTVTALDFASNRVSFDASVSLTLCNTATSTCDPLATAPMTGGVVTFGLTIGMPGDYTLLAQAPGAVDGVSGFTVTP